MWKPKQWQLVEPLQQNLSKFLVACSSWLINWSPWFPEMGKIASSGKKNNFRWQQINQKFAATAEKMIDALALGTQTVVSLLLDRLVRVSVTRCWVRILLENWWLFPMTDSDADTDNDTDTKNASDRLISSDKPQWLPMKIYKMLARTTCSFT